MTVSQKAALSLLISVLLFAGFSVLAFTGLFNFLETKFYNPSITSSLTRELEGDAFSLDNFLNYQQARFSAALAETAVKRSFLSNQAREDIYERSRIFGVLGESAGGFQWVRFIDSGGNRVHFSTNPADVFYQDQSSISYRNYPSLDGILPYETIASRDGSRSRIILDGDSDRLLFSLPFYDLYEVYRGTALFSVSIRALSEQLIGEGRIKAGEDISVISNPAGILINRPVSTGRTLFPQVTAIWNEGILKLTAIDSPDSPDSLFLLSTKTGQGFFVGRLISGNVFSFPQTMKIILLVSFFLTVYLTIFLLFNLRQDSMTIVQNRLRQLQISLIEQYYERKGTMDWGRWSRELEQRRDEIRGELKRGVKTRTGKSGDLDLLIDKSWDELLSVIEGRRENGIDEDKLQTILNRILAAPATAALAAAPASSGEKTADTPESAAPAEADVPEELEALEEADLPEELETLEEADAPPDTAAESGTAGVGPAADDEPEILEELEAEPDEAAAGSAGGDSETVGAKATDVETAGVEYEEPEELEELEELEADASDDPADSADAESLNAEPEELEELDTLEDPDSGDDITDLPPESIINLDEIARQIEFSEIAPNGEEGEPAFSDDLEIASPFKTMFTGIGSTSWAETAPGEEPVDEEFAGAESADNEPKPVQDEPFEELQGADEAGNSEAPDHRYNADLETLSSRPGISFVYKPFLVVAKSSPQVLEAESNDNSDALDLEELPSDETSGDEAEKAAEGESAENVIEEKDGIPFINKMNIENDERKLDTEFKTLVDSII